MIHIWQPNPQAPLRVWQDTTQSWQLADNWQAHSKSAKAKQACLYFPTMYLLRLQPELTTSQLKTMGESGRQYLFEEISIAPVDDLQVKTHTQGTDRTTLFALHAGDREQWLTSATLAGIDVVALVPDFLLLPPVPSISASANKMPNDSAVFYQDNDTQLLQFYQQGSIQGLAVNYLPLILSKQPQLENLYVLGDINENLTTALAQLDTVTVWPMDDLPRPLVDPTRHFLNFAVIKRDNKVPPYAKVIASVLAIALLSSFVVEGLRWYYYQKATQQAKQVLEQQYNQWFPNEKLNPKLNLQRQLASKLVNAQGTQPSILTTLTSVQPILRQHQITAQSLNYQNNHATLQLTANNADAINKAVQAVTAQGINAKLGNVSNIPPSPSNGNGAMGAVATVEIGL